MRSTTEKRRRTVRLNIYLPDPSLRRAVKTAAATRDISVSEYCVRAITAHLEQDHETRATRRKPGSITTAVEAARRFQAERFHGKMFKVSSAELIRQTREQRPA